MIKCAKQSNKLKSFSPACSKSASRTAIGTCALAHTHTFFLVSVFYRFFSSQYSIEKRRFVVEMQNAIIIGFNVVLAAAKNKPLRS